MLLQDMVSGIFGLSKSYNSYVHVDFLDVNEKENVSLGKLNSCLSLLLLHPFLSFFPLFRKNVYSIYIHASGNFV